jgi:putative transcriptional regulator
MTEQEYIKKLGQNIRKLRLEKNMSQTALAYACDMERSNMLRVESGKTNPTVKTLFKIAKALKMNLADVMRF